MVSSDDFANVALTSLKDNITSALKDLIENRHLYQSLVVDGKSPSKQIPESTRPPATSQIALAIFRRTSNLPWRFHEPLADSIPTKTQSMLLSLPTVKVFCGNCDRVEPFNPVSSDSIVLQAAPTAESLYQAFILQFQCQSCKGAPEVFMVKRQGWKLSLTGRCPMEEVKIPNYFPKLKAEGKYYSDALIAYNSGQILAGLFLLRTFIEQHTNKNLENGEGLKADQIIDAYIAKLPNDFKDKAPSLKKIYERLSAAIHTANASADLFEECRDQLDLYFDAKRVYNRVSKADI